MLQSNIFAPLWSQQIQECQGLFVVATPIGHKEDITLRALETLRHMNGILSEDTRETKILLAHYNIQCPCYSYHAHSEKKKLKGIINLLHQGKKLALVSDRGTPLISDPGNLLVRACLEENIPVHGLPGPSAITMALMTSPLHTERFFFQGFIPPKGHKKLLERLAQRTESTIFFESPHRIDGFLQELITFFGDRRGCLFREMTKKFEERVYGHLTHIHRVITEKKHVGECVLLVEGKESEV